MKQNQVKILSLFFILSFLLSLATTGMVFALDNEESVNDETKYSDLKNNAEVLKNGKVDVIIYYDVFSEIPLKLKNLFSKNVDFNKQNIQYAEITDIESFETNLLKKSTIKYFIFHGSDNGFQINKETYTWNQFAQLAKWDSTNYYSFLSCNSSPLKSLLPSKVIMAPEGDIDYKVAYFNGLLYISDYFKVIQENHDQGKLFYSSALDYFNANGNDMIKRYQAPVDTLGGDSIDDTPQHGIYWAMYEDVLKELDNLYTIANNHGFAGIIRNVINIYTLFMSTTLSLMTAGMGTAASTVFGQLVSYVEQAAEQNSGGSQPETYASNALDQYGDTLKNKIKDHFVSKGVNAVGDYVDVGTTHSGSLMDAVELILQMFAFARKYTESEFICNALCAAAATNVYVRLKGENPANINPNRLNVMQKLTDFNYALKYDWDNILTRATSLQSEVDDVLDDLNLHPGPIAAIAREMLGELYSSITEFINTHYDTLDQNAEDNTLAEVTTWYTAGGYFDDYFHMRYRVTNLGGSQGGIYYIYSYTQTNQGFYNYWYEYLRFFLAPGETYEENYHVHKHWFTFATPTQTVTLRFDATADFDGNVKTSRRWIDQYFPQTGNARITFTLGGGQTFSKIWVDLDRVEDTYSRTFKVFAGGVEKHSSIVGSSGYYGGINLGGQYTSVVLEIAWGGWKYQGWIVTQLVTY